MTQEEQKSDKLNQVLEEEKEILSELRQEEKEIKQINRAIIMAAAFLVLVVGGGIAALAYLAVSARSVYIEKSEISAPHIDLAPHAAGILKDVYVGNGDYVGPNTVVARVGDELIKTQSESLVIGSIEDIGKTVGAGQAVVTVIDPGELRVVGHIDEDKGLRDIRVGQKAVFTVDAFGGKKYEGVVDEIAPTSRQGDIVFNISDKREVREFDVKVRFNTEAYPELKDGMSAKIWIYKN